MLQINSGVAVRPPFGRIGGEVTRVFIRLNDAFHREFRHG
jgi:hypothetical protein